MLYDFMGWYATMHFRKMHSSWAILSWRSEYGRHKGCSNLRGGCWMPFLNFRKTEHAKLQIPTHTNKLLDFAALCQFANLRCAQCTLLKSQCNHVQAMKLPHHLPSFQDPFRHWAPQTSNIKWDARECHDTLPVTRWRASAAYVGTWPRASLLPEETWSIQA